MSYLIWYKSNVSPWAAQVARNEKKVSVSLDVEWCLYYGRSVTVFCFSGVCSVVSGSLLLTPICLRKGIDPQLSDRGSFLTLPCIRLCLHCPHRLLHRLMPTRRLQIWL